MRDWLHERLYLAILILAAFFILAVGFRFKPQRPSGEVTLSEAERFRLQMLTQKRSLEDVRRYFSEVATRVGKAVVHVAGTQRNGIVWNRAGLIVTGVDREPFVGSIVIEGGVKVAVTETKPTPGIPLTTLTAVRPEAVEPVQGIVEGDATSGDWLVLVSRRPNGKISFVQGTAGGVTDGVCEDLTFQRLLVDLPESLLVAGAGLFDTEGRLVAVGMTCEGSPPVAVTAKSVRDTIAKADDADVRFTRWSGLRVTDLTPGAGAYFRVKQGVLVSEVWARSAGEAAGLRPGDVVTAVDDQPLESAAALRVMAKQGAGSLSLSVFRQRRVLKVVLGVDDSLPAAQTLAAPFPGLLLEAPAPGYRIERVNPRGRAARSGLREGDRILEIDGRAISPPQLKTLAALVDGTSPAYIVVWRAGHRIGIFLA